jgi:Domain of unknown function (DUF397)
MDTAQGTRGQEGLNGKAGDLAWRRSSWCSSHSCLEFAHLPNRHVAVRDSKQPFSAPVLVFTAQEWEAFLSGVSAGEFG